MPTKLIILIFAVAFPLCSFAQTVEGSGETKVVSNKPTIYTKDGVEYISMPVSQFKNILREALENPDAIRKELGIAAQPKLTGWCVWKKDFARKTYTSDPQCFSTKEKATEFRKRIKNINKIEYSKPAFY